MSKVSIVITNYNYADYLGACIDSALDQDHGDVEVVVVDDGSTDGSRDVIDRHRADVLAVLQANGGQGAAFNAGFARATGDVVIFLDADDVLAPTAASSAAALLGSGEAVKAHWPLSTIDERGRSTGRLVPGPGRHLPVGDHRVAVRRCGPATMRFPPTSGNAWTRAFLERVLPMDPAVFRIGADTLLFEVAPFVGPMARCEEALGEYRAHGSNQWRRLPFRAQLDHELRFYDECVRVAADLCATDSSDAVDTAAWRLHGWWPRLERAVDAIEAHIPDGSAIGLIDDAAWGLATLGARTVVPVPSGPDGRWQGVPGSDAEAGAAIDGLRDLGVGHVVVAWASRWWLDAFPTLVERLGTALVATPEISIFRLDSSGPADRTTISVERRE